MIRDAVCMQEAKRYDEPMKVSTSQRCCHSDLSGGFRAGGDSDDDGIEMMMTEVDYFGAAALLTSYILLSTCLHELA